MARDKEKRTYLTPNEVAQMLMVSPVTIRQWAQKGRLQACTTPGGHRRFTPEAVAQFARENNIELPDALARKAQLKVLIVDDEIAFAELLVAMLGKYERQLEVEAVQDGFEAGRKLETFRPDVILLDLMMPKMDGFAVCRSIKQSDYRDTRIIAMSGFCSDENRVRVIAEGAELCLQKPFTPAELVRAIGLEQQTADGAMNG